MGPLLLPFVMLANVLGVGMVVPQAVRLHRAQVADGVSAAWVGVSLATNAWWLSYGIQGRLWGLLPVSVGALAVYAFIARQLRSLAGPQAFGSLIGSAGGLSLVVLAALAMAGWSAVGLTLGLAYGLQFAPAVVSAMRSATVAGVSLATWIMATAEAAIWIVYGLAVSDPALVIGGVAGTLMASVVVARLSAFRIESVFVGSV